MKENQEDRHGTESDADASEEEISGLFHLPAAMRRMRERVPRSQSVRERGR